ncbi:GGDEF domain-containing phosphodiesterase [Planktotalea arctica]|uniref:GGDEF domain-containing phosphodiesterase n=1 Tax=Planktotalea arctica TaxID=1481893 RepID=UPI000A17124D|nr:GGDEF domain-containing phosphodiesterase [Planktotalea arctica]
MPRRKDRIKSTGERLRDLFWGPQLLAFLPALCLGAYWLVGEGGLIACALGLPLLWAIFGGFETDRSDFTEERGTVNPGPEKIESGIETLVHAAKPGEKFAVFAIAIDDASDLLKRLSGPDLAEITDRLKLRYLSGLRSSDVVIQRDSLSWIIAIHPGPNLDLEATIQQASRLQTIVDEPLFLGNDRLYLSSCIGFTIALHRETGAKVLIEQAEAALSDAILNGPDAIRAYAPQTDLKKPPLANLTKLDGEIETSLHAWFQPQTSTDTGQITGFEALARWQSRDGTWLPPGTFLPVLESAGQMERLTELMLSQSLRALSKWDEAELNIDTVGVNFAEADLANPRIYDKIAWDLDRFNIAPHRLCVEVLESVVAGDANDIIVRNVAKLASLGCQIDLDDFGTGHASISTLRRLPVSRLKIDRSFVAKADLDSEQQKMVGTILMMADRLGLSCLAEGVETLGEHTILAQLGCRYVQGFGIAKPMPLEQTVVWSRNYQGKLDIPPEIGRKSR